MRKWYIGLILVVLLIGGSLQVDAKHGKYGKPDNGPGKSKYTRGHQKERNDAGYIIHRSATVIYAAQKAAQRGHHYVGLGQAVAHQQRARRLYLDGNYREAIYHSLRARDFAIQVISANRERPHRDYYRDNLENDYGRSAPTSKELDIRIDTVKVGKDDQVVRIHFGLDIVQ